MKSYIIEDINKDGLKQFNERADNLGTEKGIVYVDSNGGNCDYGYAIIDRLETLDIELVLINGFSMGFDIFCLFKGNKRVSRDAQASIHAESSPFKIFKYKGEIKIRSDNLITSQYALPEYTGYDFLTDEENEKLGQGGEILLEYNRLKEIFG